MSYHVRHALDSPTHAIAGWPIFINNHESCGVFDACLARPESRCTIRLLGDVKLGNMTVEGATNASGIVPFDASPRLGQPRTKEGGVCPHA